MDHRAISALATELVGMVTSDALEDLRFEDPIAAIELHFHPVRCRELPPALGASSDCSVDGYYEALIDPGRPVILLNPEVASERLRFTALHEIGHHLVATEACHMLDQLDDVGGSPSGAQRAEEQLCHEFAAQVLIPRDVLTETANGRRLRPDHVIEVHERTTASWEAVAVRVAAHDGRAVVVLVREEGSIAFATTSEGRWWPRGSATKHGGPLYRSLRSDSPTRQDVFRYGLSFGKAMFCETRMVHSGLAVGVMRPKRGDGQFDVLDQPEPAWKEREDWCFWCDEERDQGWCYECRSQRCHDCERCGCSQPSGPGRAVTGRAP